MKKLIPAKEVVSKIEERMEDIPVELLVLHYEDLMAGNVEYYTKNGFNVFMIDVLWNEEIQDYYYGWYILSEELRKELLQKYNLTKEAQISACLKITHKMKDLGYSIEYIGGDMNKMVIRW